MTTQATSLEVRPLPNGQDWRGYPCARLEFLVPGKPPLALATEEIALALHHCQTPLVADMSAFHVATLVMAGVSRLGADRLRIMAVDTQAIGARLMAGESQPGDMDRFETLWPYMPDRRTFTSVLLTGELYRVARGGVPR